MALNQTNDWDGFELPKMPTPPAVQKFLDSVDGDLQVLRGSSNEIALVLRLERRELQRISGDNDSSPAKMARDSIDAKATARDALTRLMAGYEAALARVRQRALDAQNAPINANEVVNELQLNTALGFVREIFAGAGVGNVGEDEIRALMGLGVPGMTQAIRTYIPVWVATQYANAGTQLRQSVGKTLHVLLDKVAMPSQAPLYSAARGVLQEITDCAPRLAAAYQMASTEVEGGIWIRSGSGALPAWSKGKLVQVFAAE